MRNVIFVGWMMALIFVVIVGWDRPVAAELSNDTQQIVNISRPFLQQDYTLIVKWSGQTEGYATNKAFMELFDRVSKQLNIQAGSEMDEVNGLPIARLDTQQVDGIKIQCVLAGSDDRKSSYLILKMQTGPTIPLEQIIQWQESMDKKLTAHGLKGIWNTMIQGNVNRDMIRKKTPEALLNEVNGKFQGQELESYKDEKTRSISLFTKKLHSSIQSGDHQLNAQAALHQDSVSGEWRLTVGIPLITMEY
jgi:hypothetical protein